MTKRNSYLRDDALKQASGVARDLLGNIGRSGDCTGCKVVSLEKER
jgi:hypothetical protein